MKKAIAAIPIGAVLLLSSCSIFSVNIDRQNATSTSPTEYTYYTSATTVPTSAQAPGESVPEPATVPSVTNAPSTTVPATTYQPVTVPSATYQQPGTAAPESTTVPQSTTAPGTTAAQSELDLSITLPEANGTMEVSTDSSNNLIRTVSATRGIDDSLLVAVYSVPESGQNYVFEFYEGERSAENLRRVYLLDSAGKITSVAASVSAERENLSVTENWFCMSVLIKGMILPAVQDQM